MASGKAAHKSTAGKSRQGMEKGVCIICGKEAEGIQAKPDTIILAIRNLRQLLGMEPRHTIVEKAHLAEAQKKRERFDKKVSEHRIWAIIVFFLLIGGSAAMGGFGPRILIAPCWVPFLWQCLALLITFQNSNDCTSGIRI